MSTHVKLAIDAMGGDFGPPVTVPASLDNLAANPGLHLIFVGQTEAIKKELKAYGKYDERRVEIKHAAEVVEMNDKISVAVRYKKDSSMRVAIKMVKSKEVDGCVSAGNTGALMALSKFILRTHPAIDRPGILANAPTLKGPRYLVDLGANVDSTADHLYQFALMGSLVCQSIKNIPSPRVALLNIGEEEIKGNDQIKRAAQMMSASPDINYVGYIEADQFRFGDVDVVVSDGLLGNVALKMMEGTAKLIAQVLKEQLNKNWLTKIGALLSSQAYKGMKDIIDPSNYNGANFVGLQGVVIKSHGSADQYSYKTAVKTAVDTVLIDLPSMIHEKLDELAIISDYELLALKD